MVNEGSASDIVSTLVDETGAAFTPTTARYRLDDLTSGTEVIAWTTIATPSSSMTVTIPATANVIVDTNLPEETKVFTLESDFGTSAAQTQDFRYQVRNLRFIT